MRVRKKPDTTGVSVEILVDETDSVALLNADLWQLADGNDAEIPLASQSASSASWRGIAIKGSLTDLTVYWTAMEPMHETRPYSVTIKVLDQDGDLLPPESGHDNPHTVPALIGTQQPFFGRGNHPVLVFG